MFKIGDTLDQCYYLTRELGRGGFGRVYHAIRVADSMDVAIKVLENGHIDSLKRFIREAKQLAAQVMNPYVVDFIDARLETSPPFLVMEYCGGGSLASWSDSIQPWQRVATALLHVSAGLSKIHEVGGFHRDIKPDNMLLKNDEAGSILVKLSDLGLARVPEGAGSSMTFTAAGTHGYIAPEVYATGVFTQQADIYSLGVSGIELLTGHRDVDKIESADCPEELKDLLFEMAHPSVSSRPKINDAIVRLKQALTPPRKQTRVAKKNDPFLGLLLAGAAAIVGGLAIVALVDEGKKEE